MALSLLLIGLVPEMHRVTGTPWDWALPAFNAGSISSHLLLVHNLFGKWIATINTPLWSVAMEWQIYFLFGLLMLPLWRRFGIASVLCTTFVVTVLPYFTNIFHKFESTCPWYVLLFAMGMTGAMINFSADERMQKLRIVVPWRTVYVVLTLCAFVLITFTKATAGLNLSVQNEMLYDILVGATTTSFLVYCAKTLQTSADQRIFILSNVRMIWLGTFSYSLYLIHFPIAACCDFMLRRTGLNPSLQFALLLGGSIPFCILCAYRFHLVFERPFMSGHPKTDRQAAGSASVSPAP